MGNKYFKLNHIDIFNVDISRVVYIPQKRQQSQQQDKHQRKILLLLRCRRDCCRPIQLGVMTSSSYWGSCFMTTIDIKAQNTRVTIQGIYQSTSYTVFELERS